MSSEFTLKKKNKSRVFILLGIIIVAIAAYFIFSKSSSEETKTLGSHLKIHYEPTSIGEKSLIEFLNKEVAPDYELTLEAVGVQDPVQSNRAVNDGEFDATIYQHQWWLKQVVEANGFKLTPTIEVFQWAFGFYSDKYKKLSEIPDGAKVSIPNDLANQAQALWLLERQGLLKLDPNVPSHSAKLKDIIENPHQFKFIEIDLFSLPRTLDSVDFSIGYVGHFDAGKIPRSKGIVFPESPKTFASRLVVATKNIDDPQIKKLQQVFSDPRLKTFIETTDDLNVRGVLMPVSKE